MAWFEPLIIIGAVAFVGLVIFLHFFLKKKGKSLSGGCCSNKCTGNCSKCHASSSCQKMLDEYHKTHLSKEVKNKL